MNPPIDLAQFYARQCYLLDEGRNVEWAQTFTEDGSFSSPTYDHPAHGHEQIAEIGRSYIESARSRGERSRHVASNIWFDRTGGTDVVRGYFTIVASSVDNGSRVARHTQFADTIAFSGAEVRVVARTMSVDDGSAPTSLIRV